MADLAVEDVELKRIFADENDGNENDFEGFSANEIMRDNFDSEIADYIAEHDPEMRQMMIKCTQHFSLYCGKI